MRMKYSIISIIYLFYFLNNINAQSVLKEGNTYKIAVTESGIHKIDADLLNQIGININTINPKNIHIYGYGSGMLTQANNEFRYEDLPENAIFVSGEDDGSFDNQDYILFYASSPDKWSYNSTEQLFEHERNLYADTTYYFLKIDNEAGLRVQNQANQTGATFSVSQFDDYVFHESEERNVIQSGRLWLGELFDNVTEYDFNFEAEGIVSSSDFKITTSLVAWAFASTDFSIQANNQEIGSQEVLASSPGIYDRKGRRVISTYTVNTNILSSNNNFPIKITYDKKGTSGIGYLDYIRLNYKRNLALYGNQTTFRSIESQNHSLTEFTVNNIDASSIIWDITNSLTPQNQDYDLQSNQAIFGANTQNIIKEFVVFRGSDFAQPIFIEDVNNQNLQELATPDLIIITATELKGEAERLASFRRTNDNLSVAVVTLDEVYNEFSSGRQDVSAIRDFVRKLYLQDENTLKYLLLFGDATYDYKNINQRNQSQVPIYESRESFHPIFSYSSDDYFGLLGEDEGFWMENTSGDADIEIGIGRLPIKSLEEAKTVVDKLIHYSSSQESLGTWRNQIAFIADDGDGNTHQRDADELAETVDNNNIEYNPLKLYMDSFEQVGTANGEIAFDLKDRIDEEVERGNLIINFTGHGAEIGWTEEKILELEQVKAWDNWDNLPLFVTATCEFGRYDNPSLNSGAEEALFNPRGGAIALITTTRPVFSSTNFLLNEAFYNAVFQEVDGEMPRLGDVIRLTKNNSATGSINRNFSLLGDPSMRLVYPKEKVVITKINGKTFDDISKPDTLMALRQMNLEGEIQNQNGALMSSFNGKVFVKVFDKENIETTFGTSAPQMNYEVRSTLLFNGTASVENGKFSITFNVPLDINYQFGNGKISIYAQSDETVVDANGAMKNIVVGGTYPNANSDNTPPELDLFLNDTNFVNGQTVEKEALLIAKMRDDNGINISDIGIGHGISMILDDNLSESRSLNEYYIADLDSYQSGTLEYPLRDLETGKHTLSLKVWDIHNNPTEKSIEFFVAENAFLGLEDVLNYPNPFTDYTNFAFTHNKVDQDLIINIEIFNTSGQKIKTLSNEVFARNERLEVRWDGLDKAGNRINPGLYIYKLTVKSLEDNTSSYITKRIVFIN